jgi:NifU-like protein involved in Fe-S cluster formation
MAYSDKVIDHYENPRNVGSFSKEDPQVGTGMVGAPACGDVMKLQIKVDENGIIQDAKFKTYGCLTSNALINTPTHSKKISELKVGDLVLAWNGQKIVNQPIANIIIRAVPVSELLRITFQRETSRKNIRSGEFSLICTKEHIFWNADNKPVEAQMLQPGQELYEITEHELRILTNNRHRKAIKEKNSQRMIKWNQTVDHSSLPQNQRGYVCKDPIGKKNKISSASKRKWNSPEYIQKWQEGMKNRDFTKPTSIEQKFISLFEEHNVAARWSAGKIWIQSSTGPVSPDFIVPGKKKCIEVYTKKMPSFMQDRSDTFQYIEQRSKQLLSAGYEPLFLAIEDIDNSLEKVQNFIHNGMKVIAIEEVSSLNKNSLRGCKRSGKDVLVYDLKLQEGAHVYFSQRVGSHNCGSAIASSSLVTEWIKGKTLDQAGSIKNSEIAQELALPPVKIHCSILASDAISAAIKDYKKKQVDRSSANDYTD